MLITNGKLITWEKENRILEGHAIYVQGDKIKEIAPQGVLKAKYPNAVALDANGQYVMPGGVDAHTHLNLTVGGIKVSDGFFEGSAAAAYGGTTCVVEHPAFGPEGCTLMHQIRSYQSEAAGACVVDFGLHGVIQHLTPQILDELPTLMTHGVSSAKIYLTYAGRLEDRQILGVLERAQ